MVKDSEAEEEEAFNEMFKCLKASTDNDPVYMLRLVEGIKLEE
jgi:hypothetical protein